MYLGVDIGGTKTLLAVLNNDGVIRESRKFPTPKTYDNFLLELRHAALQLEHREFRAAGVAVPGVLDRRHGRIRNLGNLGWKNENILADCEKIFDCPVVIENDANLGALSESKLQPADKKILYITISTGIGTGVTYDRQLVPALLDIEGGNIELPFRNQLRVWEDFASGRAIYQHFGKKAADITDPAAWKYIARNLALGFFENIAVVQPDLIIIGGSIGTYYDRYHKFLADELKKYETPMVPLPRIIQAKRPEEAVVYGCYDLARLHYA
ncbi:MAG: hypothetical protein JWN38_1273 [Candidatus Saccharibacteria bacterium]|nr:hypothetical protein [Candidatus Saccharibacteria bacterium]